MKTLNMDKNSFSSYLVSCLCWFFGLLTLEKWAVVVGIICTVGTFLCNIYIKKRQDRREERKLEFEIKCYQNHHKDFIDYERKTKK